MFRGTTPTKIDPAHFGAGSFVKDDRKHYLVVSAGPNTVNLLDMSDFRVMSHSWVTCEDANFLSESEVIKLIDPLGGTRSDYEYLPAGLKSYNDKQVQQFRGHGCGITKM